MPSAQLRAPSAYRVPATLMESSSRPLAGVKLTFAKRQIVFQEGDPADLIYEVVDGALVVVKLLSDGRRQISEVVPRGWVCGFAQDGHYDASCEALTDATVIAYPRAVLEPSDPLHGRLLRQAEEQLCSLHDLTLTLGRKAAGERLATFLMRFIPDRGTKDCVGPALSGKDETFLQIPLSRAEIADHLGLTLETISRELTTLSNRGLIQVGPGRGAIVVKDVCRLCAVARTGRNE